jgi:MFS family permease
VTAASAAAAPGPRRAEIAAAVSIALLVQTTISLIAACVPVLAPEIAEQRAWNVGVIAFYTPVVYGAAFLVTFQVPLLLRRLGGMGLCLGGVAVSAAGLLCLLPPAAVVMVAAPLAIGVANGAMNPASAQVLGPRTSPRNAGFIMSVKQTGVPLGGVLAGILVPLLSMQVGWQNAVLGLAAGSLILAAALLPTVRWLNGSRLSGPPPGPHRPFDPVKRLLAIPGMTPLMLCAMSFAAMLLCLRTFFTAYLVTDLGFSLATAGLAFSASQAAGIVGQVGWAAVSDRLLMPHAVMALLGGLMTAAAVLTAAITPDWPIVAVIAVAVLYGVSAAGHLPVVLGEVTRRAPPGQAGVLTSGANVFLIGGILIGPLAFGAVGSAVHYAAAFLLLATCTLAGSVVVAVACRDRGAAVAASEDTLRQQG